MRCLSGAITLVVWVHVPHMWCDFRAMATNARPVGVLGLPPSDFGDCRNDFGEDPNTTDNVVRSRLASHYGKERAVSQDPRIHVGYELSGSMDNAPTLSSGDGTRRT